MKTNKFLIALFIFLILASECAGGRPNKRTKKGHNKSATKDAKAEKVSEAEPSNKSDQQQLEVANQQQQQVYADQTDQTAIDQPRHGQVGEEKQDTENVTKSDGNESKNVVEMTIRQTDAAEGVQQQQQQANPPETDKHEAEADQATDQQPNKLAESSAGAASASQNVVQQRKRVSWPDQLFQEQSGQFFRPISQYQLQNTDQLDQQCIDQFHQKSTDQQAINPLGIDQHYQQETDHHQISSQQHQFMPFNPVQQNVVPEAADQPPIHGLSYFGHENLSHLKNEYHPETFSYMEPPKANLGATNPQNPPTMQMEQPFIFGQMNPPRQMPFVESAQSNATDVKARPGFYARLIMSAEKPFTHLNIPPNRFQNIVPNSNLPRTPSARVLADEQQKPSMITTTLDSPSTMFRGLTIAQQPTIAQIPTAQNMQQRGSPGMQQTQQFIDQLNTQQTVPIACPKMKGTMEANAAEAEDYPRANFAAIIRPNPPLVIREGGTEQRHFAADQRQSAEMHRQTVTMTTDRKMKRPLEATVAAEAPPSAVEIQRMQMARMMERQRRENDRVSTHLNSTEEKVSHVINCSLISLGIPPGQLHTPIYNAINGHGINFDHLFALMGLRIHQTHPAEIMERAEKWLLGSELTNKFADFGIFMQELKRQAFRMFGQPLFKTLSNATAAAAEQQQAAEAASHEEQKYSQQLAMLYFLFARIYRKMAGLLEAPFLGFQAPPLNQPIKVNEALLCWLSLAHENFAAQFDSIIKRTYADFEQKQNFMLLIEKDDEMRERLNVAQITIELTLAPLIGTWVFKLDLQSSLMNMEKVNEAKFSTLFANKGPFNLMQIGKFARCYNSRLGGAVTFLKLFNAAIEQYFQNNQGQNVDSLKRNVAIYLNIYQKALNYLSPEAEQLALNLKLVVKPWFMVKTFLVNSIQQLDEFGKTL